MHQDLDPPTLLFQILCLHLQLILIKKGIFGDCQLFSITLFMLCTCLLCFSVYCFHLTCSVHFTWQSPQISQTNVLWRPPEKHKKQAHAPCARARRPPRETRTLLKQRAILTSLVAPFIRPFWSPLRPRAQVVCSTQLGKCGARLSASLRRGPDEKKTCNVEWAALKRNKGAA